MESAFGVFGSKAKLVTMIALLTWTAGSLDAISYLQLHRIFTANMTGNTALLGIALGQGNFPAVGRSALARLGYICGVAAGVSVADFRSASQGAKPSVARALALEGALLVLFVAMWKAVFPSPSAAAVDILIVISGTVMGIQSAAVRRLNLPGVVTTYITGTITILTSGLVSWLNPKHSPKTPPRADNEIDWESRFELQGAVFVAYALAALATAALQRRWPTAEIPLVLAPIAIVLASILPAKTRARKKLQG